MKNYRPLLLQQLDVRLPGCRVRRLRLNRHLSHVDSLSHHAHRYSQVIVYVRGGGVLTVEGGSQPVAPGAAVFLPPNVLHSFDESGARRPLCLVLDLDWRGAVSGGPRSVRLPGSQLSTIRGMLSEIIALGDPSAPANRLCVAAAVLRILDVVMRGLTILPTPRRHRSAIVARVDRQLAKSGPDVPVAALAAALGYQPDYLNRAFKKETGLSLRERRDAVRLDLAKRLLLSGKRVTDAAHESGFADLNYFSRWFKKWTGVPPGTFARSQ